MKVKWSSSARSGGGGGDGLKRLLASPITPVLIGLAIVLGAGIWVLKEDAPASGQKTGQTDKGDASNSGGTAPAQSGGSGTSGTSGASGGSPNTGTKPETPGGDTAAADQAILTARAKIDRSEGAAKTMLVTAYYSDGLKNGMSLQPVEIKAAHSVARIKVTAEQVVNPPQDLKLYSNVPAGTKVLSVNLKQGVAIVDLSPEVAKVTGSGAVNNIMASFVYSLTAIPDVKAVQLWVNGRPALLDGLEWSKPLSRADLDGRNLYKVEPVIKYTGL